MFSRFHFVGLRPLLGEAGAPSAHSREWKMVPSPSGLLTVVGGRYTTYRHMGEVITDEEACSLGRRGHCQTAPSGSTASPGREHATLKESLAGPSPFNGPREIAPTHPNAVLMQRMQDSSLREIWRLSNSADR